MVAAKCCIVISGGIWMAEHVVLAETMMYSPPNEHGFSHRDVFCGSANHVTTPCYTTCRWALVSANASRVCIGSHPPYIMHWYGLLPKKPKFTCACHEESHASSHSNCVFSTNQVRLICTLFDEATHGIEKIR